MRHSIVRRSAGVTVAFLVGHALNYALMFGANYILGSGGFGLFYTAVLIITVAMSPMMAVTLVLARRLADVGAAHGERQVVALTGCILTWCMRWGLPGSILAGVLLAVIAPSIGVQAWQIALLIPVTVLALVFPEVLRAAFQSMLLFRWSSALWIVTSAVKLIFTLGALFLFEKVWAGIAGIVVAVGLVSTAFAVRFVRAARAVSPLPIEPVDLRIAREMPMIVGYSLFILLNNIDILVGYWLLSREALDVYAASALLPKAIITATFPIAQVVLPVVVEQKGDNLSFRLSIFKGIALALLVAGAAAAVLWVGVPILQNSPLAIRGLDLALMRILAIGAIALSAVRVLVVVELALQRYTVGLAQIGAVVLFGTWAAADGRISRIAEVYTMISWGFLLVALVASLSLLRPARVQLGRLQE